MKTFTNTGYWAIILGGSGGIGFATAQKLAAEGMNLCIVHRDRRGEAKAVATEFELMRQQGIQLLSFNVDATQKEAMEEVTTYLKTELPIGHKIRLLLHSIAKGNLKPMVEPQAKKILDIENEDLKTAYSTLNKEIEKFQKSDSYLVAADFQLTLHYMALSLVDWVKILFENELFAADARVIGLTSEGNQKAWVNYAAVSATKAALEAIVRSIALEYAPFGIRANVVQAGVTDTRSLNLIPGADMLKANARFRNPFGRLTRPEDVANAIYLLCLEEAAWINGAVIPVDGGERIT